MERGYIIYNTITEKMEKGYGVFFNRTTPALILKKLRESEPNAPLKMIKCDINWYT